MGELKTPELEAGSFTANGKVYKMESRISIARKIYSDKLMVELISGISPGALFNDLKKLYELCNERKFADVAVSLHNKMKGLQDWSNRRDPILALCALYLNTDDEDRKVINDEMVKAKIADWEAEGIEYGFFSLMARALLKELSANWTANIQPAEEENTA